MFTRRALLGGSMRYIEGLTGVERQEKDWPVNARLQSGTVAV